MKLPEIGVRRPVFTGVIFAVILILGAISYYFLPIDLLPEIEQPTVSIITPYLGVGAEDIETQVTKEIENSVSGVQNVEEISSISKDNLSVVFLKFKWGTDLNEAMDEIRVKLEFAVRELPSDIEQPQVFKFNTAQWPVVFYGITAVESWPNLKTLAEKRISDQLKTVPGVGTIRLIAGLKRQIQVEVDLERLRAYPNLSISQIAQAIAGENITAPLGDITVGRKAMTVRLPGEFENPEEINDVVVGVGEDGSPIKVKDIARVTDGFEEQNERVFFNGVPAIMFMVMKQTGGNTVQVVDAVEKKLEEIKKTLPSDVKIVKLFDTAEFIKDAISNLKTNIMYGGALVLFVVYLFLRNVRSSLIVILTIPFSLILAFIFMYFFGYTINIMSLASLAIAIGMVVDAAIVIFENITRHLEDGGKLNKSCVDGASEVGLAVTASAITTIVIFVPLLFVGGFSGVLFRQLGFVISITILGSLFSALTFSPMISSKLLRKAVAEGFHTKAGRLGIYKTVEKRYLNLLEKALAHRLITIFLALGLFLILGFGSYLFTRFEFMPEEDTGDFRVTAELSPGTDVNVTTKLGLQIVDIMQHKFIGTNGQKEWDVLFMRTGQSVSGFSTAVGEKEGDHIIEAGGRLIKRKLRTRTTFEYADILRPDIEKLPGIMKLNVAAGSPMQQFFGSGKPVVIEIKGANIPLTNKYANEIAAKLRNLKDLADISVSRDAGRINLSLKMNRERLSLMGLNTALTAIQLRTAIYGDTISKYREEDEEYDIFLRLKDADRKSIEDLISIPVLNMLGKQITLGNIAKIEESVTPIQIDRLDQQRVVKVEANTRSRADLQKLTNDIKKILQETPPPDPRNIYVHLGGNLERMGEAFRDLSLVALLGLLLVYLVMAAQFENLVDPLIVMFSVPFALNGVLLGVILSRISFSMYTFLGVIMLIGIVVNNAIVFVDYTNQLRRRGMTMDEALRVAGRNRLRPILMTMITTVAGMLPMALSRAEGAEFWRPLGISVIGGLSFSTFVTLILIPSIYHLVYTWLGKIGKGERVEIVIE